MDCDQVFAILTRGPFPTGASSDELVEEHLESCGDCWRFAQALRPTEEVFQEAVTDEEGRDLPGYWGDARSARVVVAQLASQAAQVGNERCRRQPGPITTLQLATPPQSWIARNLPAIVLASAVTAAVFGLVNWFRL
jgi:hypothetical protein